jgi:hypothetical protein
MAPKVKTAKNSKLPKLLENCFEPVEKGGWPPISTCIRRSMSPLETSSNPTMSTLSLRDFGLWKFVHQHIPFLPIAELLKLKFAPLLDPTINLFSLDLWCISPSGIQGFGFRKYVPQRTLLLLIAKLLKLQPAVRSNNRSSSQIYGVDILWDFRASSFKSLCIKTSHFF